MKPAPRGVIVILSAVVLGGITVAAASTLYLPSMVVAAGLPAQAELLWYSLPDATRTAFTYDALTNGASAVSLGALVTIFCLWCRPLMRGAASIPRRSYMAGSAVAVLSVVYYVGFWSDGLQYQGTLWLLLNVILNACCVLLLTTVAFAFRVGRRTSWPLALTFHFIGFAWALTVAFPWLGETW